MGKLRVENESQESIVDTLEPVRRILIEFELGLTTADIPDADCEFCESPMSKIYLDHNFGGRQVRLRTKVPGYHCPKDDANFFSNEGVVASLTKARDVLLARGYKTESKRMNDSLEHEERFLASFCDEALSG